MLAERVLIAAILLVAMDWIIFSKYAFKKLKFKRGFDVKTTYEGSSIHLIEIISNAKLIPVPWLRLECRISPNLVFSSKHKLNVKYGEYHSSIFSLLPFTKITRRHVVNCKKRGYYRLKSASITVGSLFGNTLTRDVSEGVSCDLLVYPKPLSYKQMMLPTHSWQGDIIIRRWIVEDPFIKVGVREYQSYDSFNSINWKATARTGSYKVNNYEHTADTSLNVYLNVDTEENQWTTSNNLDIIERAISYTAAITQKALKENIEIGFGSNGYLIDDDVEKKPIRIKKSCSRIQLSRIYEALAKLKIQRSVTFHTFLDYDVVNETKNTDYLILTCFLSKEIQNSIMKLKKLGNSVEVLILNDLTKQR